jgi:hypothetical protein
MAVLSRHARRGHRFRRKDRVEPRLGQQIAFADEIADAPACLY